MTDELKPCPFCGGEAEIWRANGERTAWIACMGRCSVLVSKEHKTDAEAIAAWNRRALPAADAGALGAVVKPLVWFEVEKSRHGGKYTADGYTIRYIEGLWLLDFAGAFKQVWRFPTIELAQHAAQADYESRILAALQPPTHAAQLAAALALPEVAAMVQAGRLLRQRCGPLAADGKAWDATLAALEARHD